MAALVLVHTPLAATRAARRLCDAEGGVLFGPAVSTLDRLVPGLLAAAGDRRGVLPPLAERLLAIRAGARAGGPFAALAGPGELAGGLAGALATAIAELRRGEVTAEEARSAALALDGAARARLESLAAVLEGYEEALASLGQHDAPGAMRAAATAARRGARSPETAGVDLLVADGLSALGPAETDLLLALAGQAKRTRLHLSFFPERPDATGHAEPLLRRLEADPDWAARRDLEVVVGQVEAGRAPLVAAALGTLLGGPLPAGTTEPGAGGLVLARPGAGEAGEAEAAAAGAAALVDLGFAPGEIAVVAPSPRRVAAGLRAAFAARGLPFQAGRGEPVAERPLVRLVLDALDAAAAPDRAALERLLGNAWLAPRGLPPVGPILDRAGALDGRLAPAEALRRRASGLGRGARERPALERAVAAVEALQGQLAPLASPGRPREWASRLSGFLDATGLRRRAARGPAGVAAADLGALGRLEEAAEAVVRAVSLCGEGNAPLAPAGFRALLGLAIDAAALPPGPEAASGAIELWSRDEAAGLHVRAVLVTGCGRGAFPEAPPPEPLLREPERQAVNQRVGRQALAVSGARRAAALHRAFASAAAAEEALVFTWAAPGPAGDGGPLAPAVADALAAVGLPVPGPRAVAAPGPGRGEVRTLREAVRELVRAPVEQAPRRARGERNGPAAPRAGGEPTGADDEILADLRARAADAAARGAIEVARREAVLAAVPAPFAGRIEGAGLEVLREALPPEWAPTQLEGYARCPFRALLDLVRLPDRTAPDLDIDPRDEGSLLHAVMERFVAARMARGAWPLAGDAADRAEARAVAAQVFGRFEREGRTGDAAAWEGKRAVVLARLDRVVEAEARDHGGLVPVAVEHRFGGGAASPALELSADGETVRLAGRIDRVDASPERLLVLDYKNARDAKRYEGDLEDEALGTTNFQLPVYAEVAARDFPGPLRLEASYALLRSAERLEPVVLAPGDPRAAEGAVGIVRRFREGAFPISSRTCDGCPHGAVCRFEGVAAREEEA